MELKLTERRISDLPVPTSGYERYWDTEVKGLGVKVMDSGKKSYVFQSRLDGKVIWGKGMPRCSSVNLADMRDEALQWKALIRQGVNPWRKDDTYVPTVGEVCDENLKAKQEGRKRLSKRTIREYENLTNAIKAASIASRPIDQVTIGDAHDFLSKWSDRPRQHDHARFWLSNTFDLAIKRGHLPLGANPWQYVDKEYELPKPEDLPRFTDDEIVKIADYLQRAERDELRRRVNKTWIRFMWFLLKTGMRPNDACVIKRSWIKESKGVRFVDHPETKTGDKRIILPASIEIPRSGMYLFPGKQHEHLKNYKSEFDHLRETTKLDKPPYAIRRWFASVGRRTFDGDVGPVQKLIGWESEDIALRYAGDDEELLQKVIMENAEISAAVNDAVNAILAGEKAYPGESQNCEIASK